MDPLFPSEDLYSLASANQTLLPRSRRRVSGNDAITQNVQPGSALQQTIAALQSQAADYRRRLDEAQAAPVDTTAMQEMMRARTQQGQQAMLAALAADFAGPRFQNLQGSLLRQSMAAHEPMKVGGGMVTPDGKFVRDEFAARDENIARLGRLAQQYEGMAQGAVTQQERIEAQKAAEQARAEQREADRQTRMLIAQVGRGGGSAARGTPVAALEQAPPPEPPKPLIVTPDVDPSAAMGAEGRIRNVWNKIGDVFNAGNPSEANRLATAQLNALSSKTRAVLQDAFGGRPSNLQLQLIQPLLIQPNELFLGAGTAQTRVQALQGMIAEGIQSQQAVLSAPNVSKTQQTKAIQKLQELQQLKAEYDALGQSFVGRTPQPSASSGARTPSTGAIPPGVDPEDWKYMTPQERSLWQKKP